MEKDPRQSQNIKDLPVFSYMLGPQTTGAFPEIGEFYEIDLIPGELERVEREMRMSVEERLAYAQTLPRFGPTQGESTLHLSEQPENTAVDDEALIDTLHLMRQRSEKATPRVLFEPE